MDKRKLIQDMKTYCGGGGFITRQKLAQYMNLKDPHSVDIYLYGLTRVNGRHYFIPEVCEILHDKGVK